MGCVETDLFPKQTALSSVEHPFEFGDECGAPVWVLNRCEGGGPPAGGAHPRAVHYAVWVLRRGPS